MHKVFPTMLDRPENPTVVGGLTYFMFAFVALPFILFLLMQGSFDSLALLSGVEIAYHVINFIVTIFLFRGYLTESFLPLRIDIKRILGVAAIAVGLITVITFMVNAIAPVLRIPALNLAAEAMLPMAEMELFTLPVHLIYMQPFWGTLCLVLLAPVTTSCLYYATTFAPICNNRPWLAYIVVAVLIAVPRFCNAMTFWDPTEEFILYLAQLPMHLLACWTYQKTDMVWAPMLTHAVANLLACLLLLLNM